VNHSFQAQNDKESASILTPIWAKLLMFGLLVGVVFIPFKIPTVQLFVESQQIFRRNFSPASSELKSKLRENVRLAAAMLF
jgi:hypothetical protein